MQNKKVLLQISNLKQWFPVKKEKIRQEQLYVKANDGISVDIYEGETLGLVGESGCGKSTFGRVLLQLYHQTEGKTMYFGRTLDDMVPQYVKETYQKLSQYRDKMLALQKKKDEYLASYEKLSEKERHHKADERAKIVREANDSMLDLAHLIGGFIVAKDLAPVSQVLMKEFRAASDRRRVREEKKELEIRRDYYDGKVEKYEQDGKNTASVKAKAGELQKKIDEKAAELAKKEEDLRAIRVEIDEMRKQYADDPDFAKYEALRSAGIDLAKLKYPEMRVLRSDMQLIFQDPYSSLNPRMTVGQIIGEGPQAHGFFTKNDERIQDYVMKVMDDCGLAPYMIHRYPHQFSGGQRQRIGIARSLAMKPKFVVCDEAVSALDVSIQSQVINLLQDLKEKDNLTYLFISHDLSVVKYISDRIGVMYLGNLVELAESQEIFDHPLHPYTEALLLAIPTTDVENRKESIPLEGDIPSPIHPPKGCKFHTRCKYCTEECKIVTPEFRELRPGHFVACHHPLDHGVIE